MHIRPRTLYNTGSLEAWPAWLLRAPDNATARVFARASYLMRRKRDGAVLAAALPRHEGSRSSALPFDPAQIIPLPPGRRRTQELDAASRTIASICATHQPDRVTELPIVCLQARLDALGLDQNYAQRTGLVLVPEPDRLVLAGFDRYRRPLWLRPRAARAWLRMQAAALQAQVVLEAISGYRSHDYQFDIFRRKSARGQSMTQILAVNAAPGYSEHHSGLALDIGTPGEPALEASFDTTAAFAWLQMHAAEHGFVMSYPRDNAHGIAYEPWHWCLREIN